MMDTFEVKFQHKVNGVWTNPYSLFLHNDDFKMLWTWAKMATDHTRIPVRMIVPRSDIEWEYHA